VHRKKIFFFMNLRNFLDAYCAVNFKFVGMKIVEKEYIRFVCDEIYIPAATPPDLHVLSIHKKKKMRVD
jgi:hypothetical protein